MRAHRTRATGMHAQSSSPSVATMRAQSERLGENGDERASPPSVREGGLEPPRPCGHRNLNPARLPIPPLARERRRIAQTSQYDRWPMGLQRFERRLERLVEGGFGKAFRTGLQPVEIGRRLVRELDSGRSLGVRGTVAPNQFTVRISEDDEARFAGFRDALVAELTETVRDSARASNYRFVGPVEVRMAVDPRFGVGDLAVDAAIV